MGGQMKRQVCQANNTVKWKDKRKARYCKGHKYLRDVERAFICMYQTYNWLFIIIFITGQQYRRMEQ